MNILIISAIEYGNLLDHVKWIKYLSSNNNITHLSLANKDENVDYINTKIVKIKKPCGLIKRNFYFIGKCIKTIKESKYDSIIIDYFPGCSLIKLCNYKKHIIVDLRTSTISDNKYKKKIRDLMINIETRIFDKISIISLDLLKVLKLKRKKIDLLPLGSDCVVKLDECKNNNEIKLLYVGSLDNREIHKTINAIKIVLDNGINNIKYTIIGFSKDINLERELRDTIKNNNLSSYIDFVGKVNHDELKKYYEENTIGLSYIPCKEYFQYQPPTKTYEYIINGLFCIATNTKAHKKIISKDNGVLIKDTSEELANVLIKLHNEKKKINPITISQTLEQYKWSNIVNKNLIPILKRN